MGGSEATGGAQTAAVWTALLLAANLLFILALVAALFAFTRHAAAAALRRAEGCLSPLLQRLGLGGVDESGGDAEDSKARATARAEQPDGVRFCDSAIDVDGDADGSDTTAVAVRSDRDAVAEVELRVASVRTSAIWSPGAAADPAARPLSVGRASMLLAPRSSIGAPVQMELREPLLQADTEML